MQVTIPQSFKLFGHNIRVRYDDEMLDREECSGKCDFGKQLIRLRPVSKEWHRSQAEQTFWHEAVHLILEGMGRADLSEDEKFVELMGQLVHQVIKTSGKEIE